MCWRHRAAAVVSSCICWAPLSSSFHTAAWIIPQQNPTTSSPWKQTHSPLFFLLPPYTLVIYPQSTGRHHVEKQHHTVITHHSLCIRIIDTTTQKQHERQVMFMLISMYISSVCWRIQSQDIAIKHLISRGLCFMCTLPPLTKALTRYRKTHVKVDSSECMCLLLNPPLIPCCVIYMEGSIFLET